MYFINDEQQLQILNLFELIHLEIKKVYSIIEKRWNDF